MFLFDRNVHFVLFSPQGSSVLHDLTLFSYSQITMAQRKQPEKSEESSGFGFAAILGAAALGGAVTYGLTQLLSDNSSEYLNMSIYLWLRELPYLNGQNLCYLFILSRRCQNTC